VAREFSAMNSETASDNIGLSVIIPAYNEESSISQSVSEILASLGRLDSPFEIIIIDDGSEDGTFEAARLTGEHTIRHPRNRGYGAALKTGIQRARFPNIGIIDADGTYPPQAFGKLLELLGGADMVVGSRSMPGAAIPLIRRPAKWVLRKLAEYLTRTRIEDINSGMRVLPKALAVQYMSILPDTFSFTTTLTVASLCDGYQVVYHPIDYLERRGKSKIVARNFIEFVGLLLRLSMWFRPMRLFVPVGTFALLVGMLKLVADIIVAIHRQAGAAFLEVPYVSNSALIMLIVGVQLLLMGMMAEMVSQRMASGVSKLPSRASVEITQHNAPQIGTGR
jgi:glycosyltransferase involved in cell wall biosynthesis